MFETMPKPVLIPVEQALFSDLFIISFVELVSADLSAISFEAYLNLINQDSVTSIHVYLTGLDESGVEINPVLNLSGLSTQINRHEAIVSGKFKNS
jgi:hypothetical protein